LKLSILGRSLAVWRLNPNSITTPLAQSEISIMVKALDLDRATIVLRDASFEVD
jgi:hypothetical protein